MASSSVTIQCDPEPLVSFLDGLKAEFAELPAEVAQGLLGLLEAPGEIARLESQTAGGTVKVTFHPSDRLLELVTAGRAGKV